MRSEAHRFGVYIHYPWCRYRCPYCDFPVAIAGKGAIPHEAYADALIDELARRAGEYSGSLASIYIGGGTPSIWSVSELRRVLDAVTQRFGCPDELTLEANPVDCTPDKMEAWRDAGVNRLSIGVQSFVPGELVTLGRDHRMGDGAAALEAALRAGFRGVSADFILGVPGGGRPGLERAANYEPDHLSVYELTIEERTSFHHQALRGELVPKEDDELAELLTEAHHLLSARGYRHYEISSYAKPGQESVHNSLYWQLAPYLGLGMGAASLRIDDHGAGLRSRNPRSVAAYMAEPGKVGERDEVSPTEMSRDALWLGLRSAEGVPESAFAGAQNLLEGLVRDGLVTREEGQICPTLLGFLHHDGLTRRVVENWS